MRKDSKDRLRSRNVYLSLIVRELHFALSERRRTRDSQGEEHPGYQLGDSISENESNTKKRLTSAIMMKTRKLADCQDVGEEELTIVDPNRRIDECPRIVSEKDGHRCGDRPWYADGRNSPCNTGRIDEVWSHAIGGWKGWDL